MPENARKIQKEAILDKARQGKRRLQRTFSMSVLNDHLSVKVYDSHAYISNTSVRGNAEQSKNLRKKYSCGIRGNFESNHPLEFTGVNRQRAETLSTDTVKTCDNVPAISYSLPYNSSPFDGRSVQTELNVHEKDVTGIHDALENSKTDNHSECASRKQCLLNNAIDSASASTTRHWMPANFRKRYTVLGPITGMNAGRIIDTVNIYKRHDHDARHKEKLISDIKMQAKLRISSNNNIVSIRGPRRGNQRPRRLSPLCKKPRLLEAKDAINDRRFQTLIQSLRKVNMNSKDVLKPQGKDKFLK